MYVPLFLYPIETMKGQIKTMIRTKNYGIYNIVIKTKKI